MIGRIWEGRTRAALAVRAYAGADIEKTHHLPKDPDYLLELPPYVKHVEVLVDERS